jgi:signal peptidase I
LLGSTAPSAATSTNNVDKMRNFIAVGAYRGRTALPSAHTHAAARCHYQYARAIASCMVSPQKGGQSMSETKLTGASARRAAARPRRNLITLLTIGGGAVVALVVLLRLAAFEPFNIPSGSMKPSLEIGDYIVVETYAYGWSRYSLPFGLPLFQGRLFSHLPARGDVVVFRQPANPRVDFIKRVIGLPGDKVQLRNGVVFINDVAVKQTRQGNYRSIEPFESPVVLERYVETLPEGVSYETALRPRRSAAATAACDDLHLHTDDPENTCPFEVPADHLFVLGDNRDNSADSRIRGSGVGMVPLENLVGRAALIVFSWNGESLSRVLKPVQ